jgi:hypothetical protein
MCKDSSLHNLTDMHRKASASFGLRVDKVPVVYQWQTVKKTMNDEEDGGQ